MRRKLTALLLTACLMVCSAIPVHASGTADAGRQWYEDPALQAMLEDPSVWGSFPELTRYCYMMLYAPSIAVSTGLPADSLTALNVRIMSPYDDCYGFTDAYIDYPTRVIYLNMDRLAEKGARYSVRTLAHEVRHLWQEVTQSIPYTPVDATDYYNYVTNPREWDAIVFAATYIIGAWPHAYE